MAGDTLLLSAAAAGLAGIGVLRLGWARKVRSHGLNITGWALLLGCAVLGWAAAGAWGMAVASLWPMGAALALLANAAMRSRPGKTHASNRRVGLMPERGEPLRLGARTLTFIVVTPIAAALGIGIAVALAGLTLVAGSSEANAYSLSLMLMPLIWAVLAYLLLMQPSRRGQAKVLAVASVPLWPCLAIGLLS
ncbi:hypothetical protein HNO88_003839 [Novosphingobium chloroacetimidivorans]|uniref:Uncharacterized protein n=1 Tax=Novosphingobium chloroacetimidivorans TaxID=1428314 RepID=A0A7W7NYR5_9SPHN|nr:hypothetical protein [Novosphingobium chloroacetimidivorans]MBB4860495.1 hypothetical protein [Novosphingobium chloroacetimidivorans]